MIYACNNLIKTHFIISPLCSEIDFAKVRFSIGILMLLIALNDVRCKLEEEFTYFTLVYYFQSSEFFI